MRAEQSFQPAHDKICNKTCATSENPDHHARPRSLIRFFTDRMCHLQYPGYPKRDEQEPLSYSVVIQADLNLCWSHTSYCRFYSALIIGLSAYFVFLQQLNLWRVNSFYLALCGFVAVRCGAPFMSCSLSLLCFVNPV